MSLALCGANLGLWAEQERGGERLKGRREVRARRLVLLGSPEAVTSSVAQSGQIPGGPTER